MKYLLETLEIQGSINIIKKMALSRDQHEFCVECWNTEESCLLISSVAQHLLPLGKTNLLKELYPDQGKQDSTFLISFTLIKFILNSTCKYFELVLR